MNFAQRHHMPIFTHSTQRAVGGLNNKKMRVIILTICLAFFFACGLKEKQKCNKVVQEITETPSIVNENAIDIKLLDGIWGENLNENANFKIENDSMFFLEDWDSPAPIQVVNDTLITDYGDGFLTYDKIYRITEDSLILINEFGDTLRSVRIK